MRHGRTRHVGWLLFSLLACGSPFSPEEDPLATIRVSLDASNTGIKQLNPRAALAWLTLTRDGLRLTMQEVELRPAEAGFTQDFDIRIAGPPPEHVLRRFKDHELPSMEAKGIDPNMVSSVAEVLVYHDANKNQHLDVGSAAASSPDTVVGRAKGVRVWFLERGRPAPFEYRAYFPVSEGLSVRHDPTSEDPRPGACTVWEQGVPKHGYCERSSNSDGRALVPHEIVSVTVSNSDAALSGYTCAGFWGAGYNSTDEWPDFYAAWSTRSAQAETLCKGPACHCPGEDCPPEVPPSHDPDSIARTGARVLDLPAENTDGKVFCTPDAKAYAWKTCTADPLRCGQLICHYGHGELPPQAAVPVDWPCPNGNPTISRSAHAGQPATSRPPPLGEERDALGSYHWDRQ